MRNTPVKMLWAMILLSVLIFICDIYFPGGVIAGFYICVIMLSHWVDDDWVVIGTTVFSVVLSFLTYFITYEEIFWPALTNKILVVIMIGIVSLLAITRREAESKLKRTNETLELRVLARTAASEARSKKLEQQIKLLQAIRNHNTNSSFHALDEIINNLRELSSEKEEYDI